MTGRDWFPFSLVWLHRMSIEFVTLSIRSLSYWKWLKCAACTPVLMLTSILAGITIIIIGKGNAAQLFVNWNIVPHQIGLSFLGMNPVDRLNHHVRCAHKSRLFNGTRLTCPMRLSATSDAATMSIRKLISAVPHFPGITRPRFM